MNRRADWALSEDDRILWHQIARTAKPLHPAKPHTVAQPPPKPPAPLPAMPKTTAAAVPAYHPPQSQSPTPKGHIDRQTVDKLSKGKLQLEARVDLHGMRQDEAYSLLLSFVSRAHHRGVRYVLIITGKGPGGDGVLKRFVPAWLRTPPFLSYVSGLDQAARGHGGAGAIYVRIKRQKAAP